MQSMHPGIRPPNPGAAAVNGVQKPSSSTPASFELRSSIYQTTSKASRQVSSAEAGVLANNAVNGTRSASSGLHNCDTCGSDCTLVRYHSLKDKKFEICAPCYLDGRFPSTMFSGDFVKLTSAASNAPHGRDDDWTDQEVLLLLEGVEMYDDDWSKIEELVMTRSAQQCIRKFLELPIEDPYLDSEASMGPLRYGRIPFEQADNPVMSVVAFLAGVVGPGVAAEAAKTALHDLTSGDSGKGKDESEKADEKIAGSEEQKDGDQNRPTDDRMDEDDAVKAETSDPNATSSKAGTPLPQQPADGMVVDSKPTSHAVPHSKVVRAANLALKSSAKAAQSLADAEDTQIRSTLASLIKLTLTKLELKMAQFEELEDILEEERRGLESARMALVSERLGLKKMLDNVRSEIAKNGGGALAGVVNTLAAPGAFGTSGQGTLLTEVGNGLMEGPSAPIPDGSMLQLS